MLFLALPPADMLPPAGHRARPGRSHGPHRPLRTARRAPCTLLRSRAAAAEAKAALQSSSNSSSAASPPRLEQPAPPQGPGTGRPGWHPPGKSVRVKSWPGVVGATRPGSVPVPPEGPQEHHIPTPAPQTPHCTQGSRSTLCHSSVHICMHPKARHVQLGSEGGGL